MKIAIVQQSPEFLDIDGCISKAKIAIEEAAAQKSEIVVFGETWFGGYPSWLDHCPNVALWNDPAVKQVFGRMIQNSLRLGGEHLPQLCQFAKENNVTIVAGANEVDETKSKGTIYNSIFIIDSHGQLVNHHRKLMPTFTEKLLYGLGDGAGLKSVKVGEAKITSAVCWEHWMPLVRQSLHNSGEHIHFALWPEVHEMHQIASRQYAFEGRCFVVAVGQVLNSSQFPEEIEKPAKLQSNDRLVLRGGSCVVHPSGKYVLEPTFDTEEILFVDVDPTESVTESLTLDTSGHYQRDDIFSFDIDKSRKV